MLIICHFWRVFFPITMNRESYSTRKSFFLFTRVCNEKSFLHNTKRDKPKNITSTSSMQSFFVVAERERERTPYIKKKEFFAKICDPEHDTFKDIYIFNLWRSPLLDSSKQQYLLMWLHLLKKSEIRSIFSVLCFGRCCRCWHTDNQSEPKTSQIFPFVPQDSTRLAGRTQVVRVWRRTAWLFFQLHLLLVPWALVAFAFSHFHFHSRNLFASLPWLVVKGNNAHQIL